MTGEENSSLFDASVVQYVNTASENQRSRASLLALSLNALLVSASFRSIQLLCDRVRRVQCTVHCKVYSNELILFYSAVHLCPERS